MLSKSIHGVVNGNISFFFVVEKYFIVCISHLHYPSSVGGCLHIVAIVNNVINDINNDSSMNTGVHISFQISILIFFLNIYPGVDLLDHMVALVFFKENLCTVFHSDCISLPSHQWYTRVCFSPRVCQGFYLWSV